MSAKTNVLPNRAHSAFHTTVSILDGGLINVHIEREKLDRSIVTLLCSRENRGKLLTPEKILIKFNRRHPSAQLKKSHVQHSLDHIMSDMPGVLFHKNGEYRATPNAIAALDRVEYVRLNDR